MTGEQTTHDEAAGNALLLRTDDAVYAIPQDALETFRLSDEQRSDLETRLPDEERTALQAELPDPDDDVRGHEYIGQFARGPYRCGTSRGRTSGTRVPPTTRRCTRTGSLTTQRG